MTIPPLPHDFHNAFIESVSFGPRREANLVIRPLDWEAGNGRAGAPLTVRFGGIENYTTVSAFFEKEPHKRSELAWLRYAVEKNSKPNHLFFGMQFERIDERLTIECSSLRITTGDLTASQVL